jgi:hypothetical protein
MGDAPFFGYSAKRGYQNARKPRHPLFHRSVKPPKFIRLTNDCKDMAQFPPSQSGHSDRADPQPWPARWNLAPMYGDLPLLQGMWHQDPGVPPTLPFRMPPCQTRLGGLQRCLAKMEGAERGHPFLALHPARRSCLRARGRPTWIPGIPHGGFSYTKQPLDILHNFILYFLWSKRCRKHFDDQYSSRKVLHQAWVATVEVDMATWKAISSRQSIRDPVTQDRIDQAVRAEWCHLNIFGEDCATIVWRFLPPCTFRISLMIEGTVAPPLPSPGFPRSESGSRPGA